MKSSIQFPEIHQTYEDGLLAVGGALDVATLYEAYKRGIFPWPQVGYPMLWFSPEKRGVIEFSDLHISRSLGKLQKRQDYHFTINQNFEQVIDACQAQPRKNQHGTWIVPDLKAAYLKFHQAGYAQSIECWKDSTLVGGIYGVFVEGVFSGESMFHRLPNVSKLALVYLVQHLKKRGLDWMDIQMVTPVTENLGGKYISRDNFLKRLQNNQQKWQMQKVSF